MIYCWKCGKENPDAQKFCGECGADLKKIGNENQTSSFSTRPASKTTPFSTAPPLKTTSPISRSTEKPRITKPSPSTQPPPLPVRDNVSPPTYISDSNMAKTEAGKKPSGIPPEYSSTFDPYTYCWPAFLFGILWYLYKGMWQKALVLLTINFVVSLITAGFGWIGVSIFMGFIGYKDYVRYYKTKQQFWW